MTMADLYLHAARSSTSERVREICANLNEIAGLVEGKACVYATGSFGRLESGAGSDLDVFIIIDEVPNDFGKQNPALDGIGEIKVKYKLIELVEKLGIKKFDGGGRFMAGHHIASFTEHLGSSEDDYRNTLTARMLMLLESKCLIGEGTYNKAIATVLNQYFRDFEGHEQEFMPSFLINDILRMWRTFCVNYEFSRKGESREKIKNLKLKFSRMLTCYSAIIYLLAVFAQSKTVTPDDVNAMILISPTERLEALKSENFWTQIEFPTDLPSSIDRAIELYSEFLSLAHEPLNKAINVYVNDEANWRAKSYEFGESLVRMIDVLGSTSESTARLRRLIIT